MNTTMNTTQKQEFLEAQMEAFWDFNNNALSKFYSTWGVPLTKAIPDAIQEFSHSFMVDLKNLVEKM